MVKCGVLFEVRTESLNNIYMSFGIKGLKGIYMIDLVCQTSTIIVITFTVELILSLKKNIKITLCSTR
jgi:hypothetical protein